MQQQFTSNLLLIHGKGQAQTRAVLLASQQAPAAGATAVAVRQPQPLPSASPSTQPVAVASVAIAAATSSVGATALSERGIKLLKFVGECHNLSSAADLFSAQLRAAEHAHPDLVCTLRQKMQIDLSSWEAQGTLQSRSSAKVAVALQLMLFLTELEHLAQGTQLGASAAQCRSLTSPAANDTCSIEVWMFKLVKAYFEAKGLSLHLSSFASGDVGQAASNTAHSPLPCCCSSVLSACEFAAQASNSPVRCCIDVVLPL